MRRGGGKAKGGAFENTIAKEIASAFRVFGIHEDDCYRTKNSGATKAQPGDLQFSPALAKLLPAVIECKHYRNLKYKLGKPLHQQPKSYDIAAWWDQLRREERDTRDRFGLLIMRENNCPDLVAFDPGRIRCTMEGLGLVPFQFPSNFFNSLTLTHFRNDKIIIVLLEDFLRIYIAQLHWRHKLPYQEKQ